MNKLKIDFSSWIQNYILSLIITAIILILCNGKYDRFIVGYCAASILNIGIIIFGFWHAKKNKYDIKVE
jgi:hypothetical protein